MPELVDTCPVCACNSFCAVEQLEDGRLNSTYHACDGCGLVLMNPRPTAGELSEYYRHVYWQDQSAPRPQPSGERPVRDVSALRRKQASRATHIGKLLRRILPAAGYPLANVRTVLEVGSSFGETLCHISHLITSEGGRPQLYGVEPNETAREAAAEAYQAIQLIGYDIDDLKSQSKTFDLILLSHVLEHLPQPVQALRSVRERLADRGLLYVEVPNYYGHPSLDFAHNFCFTPLSLRNTLGAAGLRVVELELTGHPEAFPFYIIAVAAVVANVSEEMQREAAEVIRRGRAKAMEDFRDLRHRSPRPEAKG